MLLLIVRQGAPYKEIEMLPYHTAFILQQDKLARYRAESNRSARRNKSSDQYDLSLAVSRALGYFAKRGAVRPAV